MLLHITLENNKAYALDTQNVSKHLLFRTGNETHPVRSLHVEEFDYESIELTEWDEEKGKGSATGRTVAHIIEGENLSADAIYKAVRREIETGNHPIKIENVQWTPETAKVFHETAYEKLDDNKFYWELATLPHPENPENYIRKYELRFQVYEP